MKRNGELELDRSQKRRTVDAFRSSLVNEAHNVALWPSLLRQQMFSRLQWTSGSEAGSSIDRILERELEESNRSGARHWLRSLTRPRESRALVCTFAGHSSPVRSCAFSPDGQVVVSGDYDGVLKVWGAASGREIASAAAHDGRVYSVAFSPNGRLIASAGGDCLLRVFDSEAAQLRSTMTGHRRWVSSAVFSPDGGFVLTASADGTVRLWHTSTGREIGTLMRRESRALAASFSEDGRRVLAAWTDGVLTLWDMETGREAALVGDSKTTGLCVFDPSGQHVVSMNSDTTISVWDAETACEVARYDGPAEPMSAIAFDPRGTTLAYGNKDGTVRLWDAESGGLTATFVGHTEATYTSGPDTYRATGVNAIAFSPDGRLLASAGADWTVRLWDVRAGGDPPESAAHEGPVGSCAFSPDGSRVLSAGSVDRTLRLWDAANGQLVASFQGGPPTVFAPDGASFLARDDEGLGYFDARSGDRMPALAARSRSINTIALSPDGRLIASANRASVGSMLWSPADTPTLELWDARTGDKSRTLSARNESFYSVAFSPDGQRLVSAGRGVLRVWDVETGDELMTLRGHAGEVLAVDYSPDGRRMVSGSWDGVVKVWDADGGEELASIAAHASEVNEVAWCRSGGLIVSCSDDRTTKVWDAESMTCIAILPCPAGVKRCAIDVSGTRVCCGDESGQVHILELLPTSPPPSRSRSTP